MIWLNPWAWIGLVGIALPVLIHTLARGHARLHRFPTLRFLDASRLHPTRRTRIQDSLLLMLRCAVIVFAVAALSQPLVLTASRKRDLDRGLARAIIIDTTASMRRATRPGRMALDSARREGRMLAATAQTSITVEANDPALALAGAAGWLQRQGRRAEIVVISDFQRGQLDSVDFTAIPRAIGVSLHRVPVVDAAELIIRGSAGDKHLTARATLSGNRTDAVWTAVPAPRSAIELLAGDGDSNAVNALRAAMAVAAVPLPIDTSRTVAIVFPSFDGHSALQDNARSRLEPWMVSLLARLESEGLGSVRALTPNGGLIIFSDSAPASITSARMAAIAQQALSIAAPTSELEPQSIPDIELAALQRPPTNDVPSQLHPTDSDGLADGRWFWLAALLLLAIEIPLRRRRAATPTVSTEEHARAA